MKIYRQGDVLIKKVPSRKPVGRLLESGEVTLALGEVTGHSHRVMAVTGHAHEVIAEVPATETGVPPAQFFEEPSGKRFLFVNAPCALTHQEHGLIALAPGCYEVVRQREYSPEAIRNVAD